MAQAIIQQKKTELKQKINKKSLERQLSALFELLKEWSDVNSANLTMAMAHWVPQTSRVYFFAVQNTNTYDREFSQNLTQLEMDVEDSEQFDLVSMKVLELPKMSADVVCRVISNYTSLPNF
jgi:hypothetical protein